MSLENATPTGKDVIYIDVDDEITGLIDKVRSSHARIVALVLPKRATVLQSVVNMKLLKHSAEAAKKHLVLITSEASLLPLAGSVGLYVAKTLQSKPEVPPAPEVPGHDTEAGEEALHLDNDEPAPAKSPANAKGGGKLDGRKTVGELATGTIAEDDIDDALELDDALENEGEPGAAPKLAKKPDKKLRVPNFNKFRLWLTLGLAAFVGLIVLIIVCAKVLPKAMVTISTNRQAINISPSLTLDTTAKTANISKGTVPAQTQQVQKTNTAQVATTGQQNNGAQASGSVTMTAQQCAPNIGNQIPDVPKGTGVAVSVNGHTLTFITQQTTSFTKHPSGGQGSCVTYSSSNNTSVQAQSGGTVYNVGPSTFSVSGRSDVSATSSAAMSGGTDSVIQVVAQADIDAAKAKLSSVDTDAVKQQLENNLSAAGSFPIPATFTAGTPAITNSANVGDQATSLTATEQITYTMYGAKQSDLQAVVSAAVGQQINTSKQGIVDYGLKGASFTQQNASATSMTLSLQDTAVVGAVLDTDTIRKQIAGKRTADATDLIKANPGVTNVTIKYSPFWVMSIPGNASKITVQIEKPQTTSNGQ